MTWKRALEADARLAAKNSRLIQAALRQAFDAERAFIGYQNTMPDDTLSLAQQRVRARAWVIMNIRPNLEPLRQVLYKIWAEAYALGDLAAREAFEKQRKLQKADVAAFVDWENWKPGDAASAILLKPPRAFQRLLEGAGITLKGFSDTTLTDIGNAIGEAIETGASAKTSAKNIMRHVASPSRALTIAITEQNRAISAATVNRYREMGVQKMRWLTFDPCKICAQNENVEVPIGQPFPSGDTQTPAHPNCRCALDAVIPGFNEIDQAPGAVNIIPPNANVVEPAQVVTPIQLPTVAISPTAFVPGKWKELSRAEIEKRTRDKLYETYGRVGYTPEKIDDLIARHPKLRADRSLIQKGAIYINGDVEIQFHSGGASVSGVRQKEIVKFVEKLQSTNPKKGVTIIIGPTKKNARGWAYLNGDKIWIAPKTAKTGEPDLLQAGSFKMPALADNPQWKYTLAHEWGHHIDEGDAFEGQTAARIEAVKRLKAQYPDAFKSEYAMEKSAEFVAEMFAEWFLTAGKTDNALVQAMAKEFGWKI